MQSEIVGVVKEGGQVKILLESGRWYQVRSEEGVEAWIYKPLVVVDQEPIQESSGLPEALNPLDSEDTTSAAASATPDAVVEFRLESTTDELGLDATAAELVDEPHGLPQIVWTAWFMDIWRTYFRDSAAYVIIALVMVLLLSIGLQLRAARHLRRALQDMGQILDSVEEIYIGGMLARTRDSDIALYPTAAEILAQQQTRPGVAFSPTEFTVLEALSDQREVQETELGKILAENGCTGVLIKAVIGGIVRKSGIMGLPWVEVRYDGGRYHYRLRPEAVPILSEQQLERQAERGALHPEARSFRPADAGVRRWIRNYSPANTLFML
jgi:Bacterial SH3 domain